MTRPTVTLSEISITANNRLSLIHIVSEAIYKLSGTFYTHDPTNEKSYFLRLRREDCGCVHKYTKPEQIPESSLFCKHGNQIIRYTDEEKLN